MTIFFNKEIWWWWWWWCIPRIFRYASCWRTCF